LTYFGKYPKTKQVNSSLKLQHRLDRAKLSLLVENTARGAGILGEHGLCWHVESEGGSLLFDLGQGLTLASNAGRMKLDWQAADSVVFSHGHYDHVGGWRKWHKELAQAQIFLHPDALNPKYQAKTDGRKHPAGDPQFADSLKEPGTHLHLSKEPVEVLPGIWTTGEVPRATEFEDTGGDFYTGAGGSERDALLDDVSLFFNTEKGLVVILGCAHAGLINILHYCMALTGERIHAVVGGMHLLHASETRMLETLRALREIAPDYLAPNHCTGDAAVARIYANFPERMLELHAGQSMQFPVRGSEGED
jgi:7,8-dihydropterin-6-yl-methyl-4-(beta-D-ribofuranosyl)aminobenzene 5'-phosphate synthase